MFLAKLYSGVSRALRPSMPPGQSPRHPPVGLLTAPGPTLPPARHMNLGLNNQYNNNALPNRLKIAYAAINYWETIPLFCVCIFDILIVFATIVWDIRSRVDLQFTHGYRVNKSMSRNMNMFEPTINKHLVLYQRYEPWPELQMVLDKMTVAEKRLQSRMEAC